MKEYAEEEEEEDWYEDRTSVFAELSAQSAQRLRKQCQKDEPTVI